MKRFFRLAGVALTLLAGACSKAPEPKPSATEVTTPVPAAADVQIRSLELGRAIGSDKRVTDPTTSFAPADTIYVAALTQGATALKAVTARFVYGPDRQLVNESTQTIASSGPAVTEFHVTKPDGWPVGTYAVEVSMAGAPARRAEFKVE